VKSVGVAGTTAKADGVGRVFVLKAFHGLVLSKLAAGRRAP
jgi:hypothetical protein